MFIELTAPFRIAPSGAKSGVAPFLISLLKELLMKSGAHGSINVEPLRGGRKVRADVN